MTDRELMQTALDALEESVDTVQHEYDSDWRHGMPTRKTQLDSVRVLVEQHKAAIAALRERLAHCDRCGKRLGGEGDIHTCTPHEQKRFEQWWDAGDDIPNDAPYTPDTPIQFAWAGWQAALAQPKQEGDIHTCSPDPIGDAQDRLIAEMAAQPEQELVAWMHTMIDDVVIGHRPADLNRHPERWKPLVYTNTTPPAAQRQWVGLTDEELNNLPEAKGPWNMSYAPRIVNLARAIEQRLKEKNT